MANRAAALVVKDSVRFGDFQERLDRPIRNIREVMVRQTLSDQFVSVLRDVVIQNPLYHGQRKCYSSRSCSSGDCGSWQRWGGGGDGSSG